MTPIKNNPIKPSLIVDTLNSMTRDELRAVATKLGVKCGKAKNNTVGNLMIAFANVQAQFTIQFTVRSNPTNPDVDTVGNVIYSKKLRTHKPDKIMTPIVAEPAE